MPKGDVGKCVVQPFRDLIFMRWIMNGELAHNAHIYNSLFLDAGRGVHNRFSI